ncbi:MAG: transglycosylase domain-containing protein, partial [Burkholderiales bacterium]|nr:transglycosylase domain-containing protein [Burkholderiales bacterium]
AEYANERRLYLPIQAVPKRVINAFLAAEDKNFYEHGGLDFYGIAQPDRDLRDGHEHAPLGPELGDHQPVGGEHLHVLARPVVDGLVQRRQLAPVPGRRGGQGQQGGQHQRQASQQQPRGQAAPGPGRHRPGVGRRVMASARTARCRRRCP